MMNQNTIQTLHIEVCTSYRLHLYKMLHHNNYIFELKNTEEVVS